MALREATRIVGGEVITYTDELVRCIMKSTADGVQVWAEWKIQLGPKRSKTVTVRCTPDTELAILSLPNLGSALDMARDDTHDQAVNG